MKVRAFFNIKVNELVKEHGEYNTICHINRLVYRMSNFNSDYDDVGEHANRYLKELARDIKLIDFKDVYYRKDIAHRAFNRK